MPGIGIYALWRWWIWKSGISADWENWVLSGREKFFDLNYLKILIGKNISGEVVGRVITILAGVGLLTVILRKEKKMRPILVAVRDTVCGMWLLKVT